MLHASLSLKLREHQNKLSKVYSASIQQLTNYKFFCICLDFSWLSLTRAEWD